ncbi:hypothetical protein Apmu_0088_07 [Acidiphilium multivorum AIU301]|nr:hypothetical protein Apmu_0088_07 [Acidiphilium multivorum AIU301]
MFLVALGAMFHYGFYNPDHQEFDSGLAAFLSLIGLFFGVYGVVRGARHRWFGHVLQRDYLR